jgi:hypothetical protein
MMVVVVLFFAAVFVGFAAFFYNLYECWQLSRLNPRAFKWGLAVPLPGARLSMPSQPIEVGRIVLTEHGKFKFTGPDQCLFTRRQGLGYSSTPFPFKGTVIWDPMECRVRCRLPLGTTTFYAAGHVAMAIFLWAALIGNAKEWPLVVGVVGGMCVVDVGIVWWSLTCERRMAMRVLGEIEEIISRPRLTAARESRTF